ESRFEANFSRLGFHPGFALSLTLPRIVGHPRAARLLYGGRPVRGEQALALGLVDQIAEPGEERPAAIGLARELASAAPLAVRSIRRTLRRDLLAGLEQALEHELDEQERLWQTEDCATGIASALERQVPTFLGR
ncbi:MAG: enoyl-CoA hydratase/isomerase family protein, partial [Nocardioides sp.]